MRDEVTRAAARRATLVAVPVALLAGVLVFWLLSHAGRPAPVSTATPGPAATGPVGMAAPPLTDRAATLCRALVLRLPDALGRHARRPVTAGAAQNAAYGDPPITLACAAGPAPSVAPDAQLLNVSGVCWGTEQLADRSVWTTVDREVPITVTVPQAYEGPSQQVIDFTDPIIATVPRTASPPTGCG